VARTCILHITEAVVLTFNQPVEDHDDYIDQMATSECYHIDIRDNNNVSEWYFNAYIDALLLSVEDVSELLYVHVFSTILKQLCWNSISRFSTTTIIWTIWQHQDVITLTYKREHRVWMKLQWMHWCFFTVTRRRECVVVHPCIFSVSDTILLTFIQSVQHHNHHMEQMATSGCHHIDITKYNNESEWKFNECTDAWIFQLFFRLVKSLYNTVWSIF
jgi:hypothetical protein